MRLPTLMLLTASLAIAQTVLPDGVRRYDRVGPTPSLWQYLKDNWGWIVSSRPFGKSVAFLVGVGDYAFITPKLRYVGSDLNEMREFLLKTARFDSVYVAQDDVASADLVERYMYVEFPHALSSDDRLLFYFSGHGTDIAGTGYMQFGHARSDYERSQYLEVTRCQLWSKRLAAKHVLFILDACNSGLGYDAKGDRDTDVDKELLNQFSGDGSRIVLTAGTGNEKSFQVQSGNEQGYSVFTRALLDAVRNTHSESGFLILDEVLAAAERQVAAFCRDHAGRQMTPRKWQIPREVGTDKGTFVFLNPRVKSPDVPTSIKSYVRIAPKGEEAAPEPSMALGPSIEPGAVGIPFRQALEVSSGTPPYVWDATSLPDGLHLDRSNGVISGTPLRRELTKIQLTVSDSKGHKVQKTVEMRVVGPPGIRTAVLLNGSVGVAYKNAVEVNEGLPPYAWSRSDGTMPPGLSVDTSSGIIAGTPSTIGEFQFTLKVRDRAGREDSHSYTISCRRGFNVSTRSLLKAILGLPYRQILQTSGGVAPNRWTVTRGALPTGLSIIAATGEIKGTPTSLGVFSFYAQADDSSNHATGEAFSIAVIEPLRYSFGSLKTPVIDIPYTQRLEIFGGSPPISWRDPAGFPPGLRLTSDGVITGTPTATGDFNCSAVVSDAGVDVSGDTGLYGVDCCEGRKVGVQFTLVVDKALHIEMADLPPGVVGTSYSGQLTSRGGGGLQGEWALQTGTLPDGLSLQKAGMPWRGSNRFIGGVPTKAGRYDMTLRVTDASGATDAKSFSLIIVDPLGIKTGSPSGAVGRPFSATFEGSGGLQPYVWSIQSSLPRGLLFDPKSGTLSGVPREDGSFPIVLWVSDTAGFTASSAFDLLIRRN